MDPYVFVTTRFKYGDRPAGCMAIAEVCETAERFRKGKEEAAWPQESNVCGQCHLGHLQQREHDAGVCRHGDHYRER
jgi:hypothetical protein